MARIPCAYFGWPQTPDNPYLLEAIAHAHAAGLVNVWRICDECIAHGFEGGRFAVPS
jgi:hypothetical protein